VGRRGTCISPASQMYSDERRSFVMRVSASIEYVRRWETARCFPLPPPFSPESQPDPTRERQQHFRRFPESEIAAPAPPIRSQFLYRRFHADTLCPSRDLPDSLLQRLFSSSGAFNPHNTPVRCGLVHRAGCFSLRPGSSSAPRSRVTTILFFFPPINPATSSPYSNFQPRHPHPHLS
jgi:hypothetical protein